MGTLAVRLVPAEADLDRRSLVHVVTDELAFLAVESADHRRIELRRAATVEPPDGPFSRGGIERARADRPIGARG
jgi:hypothetical protein